MPISNWGRQPPLIGYLICSFRYSQPSLVYSQALEGATDRADITVMMPVGREEGPKVWSGSPPTAKGFNPTLGTPNSAMLLEVPLPTLSIPHRETDGQDLTVSEATYPDVLQWWPKLSKRGLILILPPWSLHPFPFRCARGTHSSKGSDGKA